MQITVSDIATMVGGVLQGDGTRLIRGAAGLDDATSSDITYLKENADQKSISAFGKTLAGAIIIPKGMKGQGKVFIEVKNPVAAFAQVLGLVAKDKQSNKMGIHPTAVIATSAVIGKDVNIGPYVVIDDHVVIGDRATLVGHVFVGARSVIGKDTYIYPNVVIREDVQIGERCLLHAGGVIGSDGYGFYFANGTHQKIPQIGSVVIEDDVEIGSCTTIDRATTGRTIVRRGTKIDNLVQIAHNVEIGENSLIVAQVGIAGSSKLGKGVVLAGQVGVADHVIIGDGVQVGAQSGLKDNVPNGAILFGTPAQPIKDTLKQFLLIQRLPELYKELRELKEKIDK